MQFRRKIYDELLVWKKEYNGQAAARVEGARRVGKSTIVEQFAKEQYRSYILIDFVDADEGIRRLFIEFKANLDMLFTRLQLATETVLYDRESVLIFDEVQAFPPARELIKVLVKDGRFDYIETGSLISVKSNVVGIRIPSEEHTINMYPMDFEEWLWANGDEATSKLLRSFTERKEPFGDGTHKILIRKYLEYMVVGGMPQAVSAYLVRRDLMAAERVKKDIINLYRNDIRKMPAGPRDRALNLFNSIPAILSSPHKVLSPSKIEKGSRLRDYNSAALWLCDAMIFNNCRCSIDPGAAIGLWENMNRKKCYLLDTGLLISLAFQNDRKSLVEAYGKLLDGDLSINKGMFFENTVAQELVSLGYDLWFTEFDKTKDGRKYEVDFILPKGSSIIPLEVKSSRSSQHVSLDRLIEKYRDRISSPLVVHTKDFRTDGAITYIPIYLLPFYDFDRERLRLVRSTVGANAETLIIPKQMQALWHSTAERT